MQLNGYNDLFHFDKQQIQSIEVSEQSTIQISINTSFNQIWNTQHKKTIESTIQTLGKD